MSETVRRYIAEDIEELERLKKRIPLDKEVSKELTEYKEMYHLFNTTLKMAVINGTITESEASELRNRYANIRSK